MSAADEPGPWTRLRRSLRTRFLSGLLVLVPLGFTVLVLRFLYRTTAGALAPLVTELLGEMHPALLIVASVLALVAVIYVVGVVTANFLGRRLLALGEFILRRIPLVRPLYSGAKQVIDTFSVSDERSFQRVVYIEWPRPGLKVLGFLTGTTVTADGRRLHHVFVPAALMPTAGTLEFVPADQVEDAQMTVEQAMRMLISGGILAPETREGPKPGSNEVVPHEPREDA